MIKSYEELMSFDTYEERLNYLQRGQVVSELTFGSARYLNQMFYKSREWQRARIECIIRDDACDLAIPELQLIQGIYVHHINPITIDDVKNSSEKLFDLNNLITVSFRTHEMIHYGKKNTPPMFVERKPNDTIPWR